MKKIIYLFLLILTAVTGYYFYPEHQLSTGQKANKIVIYKTKHQLLLFNKGEQIASYKISISKKGLAKKRKLGDNLTPEGKNFKGVKRANTKSSNYKYPKSIEVGYWGQCCGVLIHGQSEKISWLRKFHRWRDRTEGCIMVTNDEFNEIYNAVDNGVIIDIYP
ncbi:MAG: L,D-transpeptidase [Bacteroidetes bacterium]|nr:L,D-transpeptidase [Bacteroidota bacterium]